MKCWKMVAAIVPRGEGEKVSAAAVAAGAGGGTVLLGRGTAPNAVMQFLGLGERSKEVTLNIVGDDGAGEVCRAVRAAAAAPKTPGVAFTSELEAFARSGDGEETDWRNGKMDAKGNMAIVAIVNRDYADDALAAARKAGAKGGTVLQARGTAKEGDAAFFGVRLVPEKDVLVVIAGADAAPGILEAIRKAPCFAEKGSGIVFAFRAETFSLLGGNAAEE